MRPNPLVERTSNGMAPRCAHVHSAHCRAMPLPAAHRERWASDSTFRGNPMTKLNHNRPLLRYIDSVKRQIALDAQRERDFEGRDAQASLTHPRDSIFPLLRDEAGVVSLFFRAIEQYVEAESLVVAALASKSRAGAKVKEATQSRESAENQLVRAAAAFTAQTVLSALNGRMNLYNLYGKVKQGLSTDSPFLWDTINDFAMRSAMQEVCSTMGLKLEDVAPEA